VLCKIEELREWTRDHISGRISNQATALKRQFIPGVFPLAPSRVIMIKQRQFTMPFRGNQALRFQVSQQSEVDFHNANQSVDSVGHERLVQMLSFLEPEGTEHRVGQTQILELRSTIGEAWQ
jgi:hypothetical protein